MMTWPWTNVKKELESRIKELEDPNIEKTFLDVDEVFKQIRNRPPLKWYEKLWNKIHFTTYDAVWYIYQIFKPCHQKIRKAIPRHWVDQVELIRNVNFAFITEFYEHEFNEESFLTNESEEAVNVVKFLKESYKYITEGRNLLQNKIDLELDAAWRIDDREQRSNMYKEIHNLEQELDNRDTDILVKLMQYREWMWS